MTNPFPRQGRHIFTARPSSCHVLLLDGGLCCGIFSNIGGQPVCVTAGPKAELRLLLLGRNARYDDYCRRCAEFTENSHCHGHVAHSGKKRTACIVATEEKIDTHLLNDLDLRYIVIGLDLYTVDH